MSNTPLTTIDWINKSMKHIQRASSEGTPHVDRELITSIACSLVSIAESLKPRITQHSPPNQRMEGPFDAIYTHNVDYSNLQEEIESEKGLGTK